MDAKQKRFLELVDGAVLRTAEQWPGELFLVRGYVWLMNYCPAQNEKNNLLMVERNVFWSVFESEFFMNHQEIQTFLQDMVDEHLNWKVTTPGRILALDAYMVDEHLNWKVTTPVSCGICTPRYGG